LDWIQRSSVFKYVNPDVLLKCCRNGFLAQERPFEYVVMLKGAHGFLYVVAEATGRILQEEKSARSIAEEIQGYGLCFGGLAGDTTSHHLILQRMLTDLLRAGIVNVKQGRYGLTQPADERARRAQEAIIGLFSRIRLRRRDFVDRLLSHFKEAFRVDQITTRTLVEFARKNGRYRSADLLLDHISHTDLPIEDIVHDARLSAIEKQDMLTSAALASLEAQVVGDSRNKDRLYCDSWIRLAVFCKRIGLLEKARDFYLRASDMFQEHSEDTSAQLQMANALECERKIRLREGDYEGAIQTCSKVEAIWNGLKRTKEAVYCRCMKLEIQSRVAEDMGNCVKASELMLECSKFAGGLSEQRRIGYLAASMELKAKHVERLGDHNEAARLLETAAGHYEQIKNLEMANRLRGRAHQYRAVGYKESLDHSFADVASEFLAAKEEYDLAKSEEAARICESDYCKYKGLQEKNISNYDVAISHFMNGRAIQRKLAGLFPIYRNMYLTGADWFEGMLLETEANKHMLSLVQKRESLKGPIEKLRSAADIFAQLGEQKHADIDYCLAAILMAVDEFHAGNVREANQLLIGAKQQLPPDFTLAMLEDEVRQNWEPFRYTLHMIERFNKYARTIETEKGFSFESRVREVLGQEYSTCGKIESKNFVPEDDEIGIVFPDRSAIQIDAFGLRQHERKIYLLVAEMKNQQQLVDGGAISLFENKVKFVRRRYSKLAKLESLRGAEVEEALYISRSGFTAEALDRARAAKIVPLDRGGINDMAKRHGIQTIP